MVPINQQVVAQLLRAISDGVEVHEYAGGALVDLPLTYGDGDSVRVLVEQSGHAVRVTDRAEAIDRLASAGISVGSGRASAAVREALNALELNRIASTDDEIASFGDVEDTGRLILDVAQTAIRVEQLRWLASVPPERRFVHAVKRALSNAKRWTVRTDAVVPLRSGRSRRVTASVRGDRATVLIQALTRADPDRAIQSAYFTFTHLADDRVGKLVLLDGRPGDWPDGSREDLESASDVRFVADVTSGEIESTVDRLVSAPFLASPLR